MVLPHALPLSVSILLFVSVISRRWSPPPTDGIPQSPPSFATDLSPVVCAVAPTPRSALVKLPKSPRQNTLKRTAFTHDTLQTTSPISTMQPAEVVSHDYDALISGNRCSLQLPPELKRPAQTSQDNAALLPPPFGAGYIFPPNDTLSFFDQHGSRVIFSVDSRCEPYNLIRRDVVDRANLQPFAFRTRLALGDSGSVVESEEMVVLQLRIVINDRPRLFTIRCVVRPTLAGELIISIKTALS
jgi:hypothetical protein